MESEDDLTSVHLGTHQYTGSTHILLFPLTPWYTLTKTLLIGSYSHSHTQNSFTEKQLHETDSYQEKQKESYTERQSQRANKKDGEKYRKTTDKL